MDATAVLGIGGFIFGAVGAVAGVIAVVYARKANRFSGDANDLAMGANDLAKGSNAIALDARKIALEANEYSQRAEDRDTERHDVYWEGGWVTKGVYRVYKRGDDAAHDVVATVTVDGDEQTVKAPLMQEDHGWLDFHFPGVAAKREQDALDAEEAKRRAAAAAKDPLRQAWPQSAVIQSIEAAASPVSFQVITERIYWTTDRGTPKSQVD